MFLNILIIFISSSQNKKLFQNDEKEESNERNKITICQEEQIFTTRIDTYTTLCLISCNFSSIRSFYSEGGAVYLHLNQNLASSNIFTKCIFNDCRSLNGGAIYISTTTSCESKFENCTFTNNFVYQRSTSETNVKGGALYIERTNSNFTFSTFKNNTSYSYSSNSSCSSYGGCIYLLTSNCSINECFITNNTAYGYHYFRGNSHGGFLYCNLTEIDIHLSSFNNNSIFCITDNFTSYLYSYGGCLYLYNQTKMSLIETCNFSNNLAFSHKSDETCDSYGGCMYLYAYLLTVNSSLFYGNWADSEGYYGRSQGGGIYIYSHSNFSLIDCQCNNNFVRTRSQRYFAQGGFINIEYSNALLNNNSFNNNSICLLGNSFAYGGVIYYFWSSCIMNQCNFASNYVFINSSGNIYCKGGIIYFRIGNYTTNECKFYNNSVYGIGKFYLEGEGFYCDGDDNILLNKCDFSNNSFIKKSLRDGGLIIYFHNGNLTLNQCFFNNMTISSSNYCNLIYIDNHLYYFLSKFSLTKCEFMYNHIKDSNVEGFIINDRYGLEGNTNLTISNCLFCNNSFENLSIGMELMYFESYRYRDFIHHIIINNSQFSNNYFDSKNNYYNCLFVYADETNITFEKCNFINNTFARNDSQINGMFYFDRSNSSFYDCLIINSNIFENQKTNRVLYFVRSNATIDKCSFDIGRKFNGNLIYFSNYDQYSNLTIKNCFFKSRLENHQNGSMIYLYNSINSTSYDIFINNDIIQLGSNQIVVFGGELRNSNPKRCVIYDNCIYPNETRLFKNSSIEYYNQEGTKYVSFDEAFNKICDPKYYTKSLEFTPSFYFSSTNEFSGSACFTQTKAFSQTQAFSKTAYFTKTNYFSFTNYFSVSNQFTKTNDFTRSMQFTQSTYFTRTNDFSQTFCFSKTNDFTRSMYFTKSNDFSEFVSFSKFDYFTNTKYSGQTFILSKSNDFSKLQISITKNDIIETTRFDETNENSNSEIITKDITTSENNHFSQNEPSNIQISSISSSTNEFIHYPENIPTKTKGGLSKTSIIGIVVGCLIFLILITIIIIFIIYKNKQRMKTNDEMKRSGIISKPETNNKQTTSNNINSIDEDELSDLDFWL